VNKFIATTGSLFLFAPLLVVLMYGLFYFLLGYVLSANGLRSYGIRCMLSVDQCLNTCWNGSEDETISSRAGKGNLGWLSKPLCKVLNWVDDNHCKDAIEADEGLK